MPEGVSYSVDDMISGVPRQESDEWYGVGCIAKNVKWSIVVVLMESSKKTITSSLLFAFVFFMGGSCVFPMASAQAAEMDMSGASQGDEVQNIHCSDHGDSSCGLIQNQNDFGGCFSCGNSATKTAVVKKTQDTLGLSVFNHSLGFFLSEARNARLVPHTLTGGGGRERLLLSVAKKE